MWTEFKIKTKPSHFTFKFPRVLLFDLAHKQCSGVIKEWRHCLISKSKGKFLVSNILMFDSVCLIMAQIQFSLTKKTKIGRPEQSVPPTRYTPTPSLKVGVICSSPLKGFQYDFRRQKLAESFNLEHLIKKRKEANLFQKIHFLHKSYH